MSATGSDQGPRVVAVGGGHGLAATLRACQPWAGELTAIVSVADDGGSSGRLRAMLPDLPAPGDLRRCLTTLAGPERSALAAALERRFHGGELDGHAAGNLLLVALADELGDFNAAVDELAAALGVRAKVIPAVLDAVELVGQGPTGEVRGQVAVEAATDLRSVRLDPVDAEVPKAALEALAIAELVVLGPGSLYGSVLAALAAPALAAAVAASPGRRVLVANLHSRRSSGAGDDIAPQVEALQRHGVRPDVVIVPGTAAAAGDIDRDIDGIEVVAADVARPDGLVHDPPRLGPVLQRLSS